MGMDGEEKSGFRGKGSGWAKLNGHNGRLTAVQVVMFTPRRVRLRDVLGFLQSWPWMVIIAGIVIGTLLGFLLSGI